MFRFQPIECFTAACPYDGKIWYKRVESPFLVVPDKDTYIPKGATLVVHRPVNPPEKGDEVGIWHVSERECHAKIQIPPTRNKTEAVKHAIAAIRKYGVQKYARKVKESTLQNDPILQEMMNR